jgi:hypothetical protein
MPTPPLPPSQTTTIRIKTADGFVVVAAFQDPKAVLPPREVAYTYDHHTHLNDAADAYAAYARRVRGLLARLARDGGGAMRQPFTSEPTFEERMGAAYDAGRKARADGLPLSRSPFSPGTLADTEWRNCWHEARAGDDVSRERPTEIGLPNRARDAQTPKAGAGFGDAQS